MNILGVYDGHNTNAASIVDGKINRAVEEERFSRIKNHDGRIEELTAPFESVKYCIQDLDGKIDAIALALETPEDMQRRSINSYLRTITEDGYTDRLSCSEIKGREVDGYEMFMHPFEVQEKRINKIKKHLNEAGVETENIPFFHVNHHMAHVASVYYTNPHPEALIVSLDGRGDDLAGMVAIGKNGNIEILDEVNFIYSLGHLYSAITVACGFRAVRHEGKITGLAAYAEPHPQLYAEFEKLFKIVDGKWKGEFNKGLALGPYPDMKFGELINRIKESTEGVSREEMSATVQIFTEKMVIKYVEYYVKKYQIPHVLLAGGLFANVKVNQRVAEIDGVDTVYVHPAMSDAGIGVGAALMCYHHDHDFSGYSFNDAFFGPEYSVSEIEQALKEGKLNYFKPENIEEEVAQILADGKLVARFEGRLEYGPRALGNRSILYQTTDKTVNDWLNKHLTRTEFMPFAPITLYEERESCFLNTKGTEHTAQFMTITYDCTDQMKEQSPAVVHIDGTARPQLVSSDNNPNLYKILKKYHDLTGIPSLVNTSFNVHEEPIVCSPADAVKSFKHCHFDYMQLGPFLVKPS
ncbi:carbamoyltransferase [bacterium]|nr:carbamoyltransferase [bacterium]